MLFRSIKVNDTIVTHRSSINYLGVSLDQDLSGTPHGKSIIQKANRNIKFFYRKNSFFGPQIRKMLCSSLFQPIFDYGCNSWYRNLTSGLKHKLQTAQNKVIRFVLGVHPRFHIGFQNFKQLGWLNVQSRVDFFVVKHM